MTYIHLLVYGFLAFIIGWGTGAWLIYTGMGMMAIAALWLAFDVIRSVW